MIKAIIGLSLIFIPIYLVIMLIIQKVLKETAIKPATTDSYGKREFVLEAMICAGFIISPVIGLIILFWK